MKKICLIIVAMVYCNFALMAQSEPIFPKSKIRTYIIPYEKQPAPVLFKLGDSSVRGTLTTKENSYNKGKYTLKDLYVKDIYEVKYARKGRGYWIPVCLAGGVAVGAAAAAVYANSTKAKTIKEGASKMTVTFLICVAFTGGGLMTGIAARGEKTTLPVYGSQTKYEFYKTKLNEVALVKSQLPEARDVDGNKYTIASFCGRDWMRENLKTTRYRNGDSIFHTKEDGAWNTMSKGAFCLYKNDSTDLNSQGMLYNLAAVVDSRGLCPEGWHVPSYQESSDLISCLEIVNPDRKPPLGAKPPEKEPTNLFLQTQYNFAPASGYRDKNGKFSEEHSTSQWWTSTSKDSTLTKVLFLQFTTGSIFLTDFDRGMGLSVRCIRDK